MTRYTSFAFPEIAYVPGKTDRPTEEPLTSEQIVPLSLSENPAITNPFFLYGIDLFNHGFFWEAHESWEIIWKLEDDPVLYSLLKGMIQISGGYLKLIQENEQGARKLWHRSQHYISRDLAQEAGIDLVSFFDLIENDDGIHSLLLDLWRFPLILTV